ncbi:hypothetical protein GW17_00053659 [Ensete ventricosum]|nr:hypothetical protein GW17_00053659 [Ensete ventricosum]
MELFVDMNATGLRKILKKFDKRYHSRFTDYYVSSRASHPYSQLQQVFKHVVLLGSARAVNRRYISDCVPLKTRMQASAGFVSASALGMACGPALAGLLQTNFKIYTLTFNQNTLPGWLMALAWLIYLFFLSISFREPVHEAEENHIPESARAEHVETENLEDGLVQPLLLSSKDKLDEDEDQDFEDSEESSEDSHKPATSIASAYRLLTPSVKVRLYLWQILLASELMVLVGIMLSFHFTNLYSVPQYVSSALIIFVSAEVLEGVNLSLLSRVMSSRLARGTYNGGLLSTEAGTLARVFADGTITIAGYLGDDRLLNATLFPSLLICLASIVATFLTYSTLY